MFDAFQCGLVFRSLNNVDRLFRRSVHVEGKWAWLRLMWIDSLDRHSRGKKVGLTPPHVDQFFGRPLPWGKKVDLTLPQMDRSTLWTVTSPGVKGGLTSPLVDRLFGLSLRCEGKSAWLRRRWIDSLDSHFPVKESRPDLASGGSTLWTVTSPEGKSAWLHLRRIDSLDSRYRTEKSAWPSLRLIHSFSRHFPV